MSSSAVNYKDFFDPWSKNLDACDLFDEISTSHKTFTILITTLASILLIYPGIVTFRALAYTFYKIEQKELENGSTLNKTNEIGKDTLKTSPSKSPIKTKTSGEEITTRSWFTTIHIFFYFDSLQRQKEYENILFDAVDADDNLDFPQTLENYFQSLDESWHTSRGVALACNKCRETRTIEYYDSMKNFIDHKKMDKTLAAIAQKLNEQDPGETYQFSQKIEKKLQKDWYNCGPWILYFLKERGKNPLVDFNKDKIDISSQRKLFKTIIIEEEKKQRAEMKEMRKKAEEAT